MSKALYDMILQQYLGTNWFPRMVPLPTTAPCRRWHPYIRLRALFGGRKFFHGCNWTWESVSMRFVLFDESKD